MVPAFFCILSKDPFPAQNLSDGRSLYKQDSEFCFCFKILLNVLVVLEDRHVAISGMGALLLWMFLEDQSEAGWGKLIKMQDTKPALRWLRLKAQRAIRVCTERSCSPPNPLTVSSCIFLMHETKPIRDTGRKKNPAKLIGAPSTAMSCFSLSLKDCWPRIS